MQARGKQPVKKEEKALIRGHTADAPHARAEAAGFDQRIIPHANITKVKFRIIGSDEIRKISNVQIVSYDLFAKNNIPYPGGVCDGHLGTTDHAYRCETCFNNKKFCFGHPGHLELRYPVYSPMALADLKRWIRLICFECGYPVLAKKDYVRFPRGKRLEEASKLARTTNRKCHNCGTAHPIVKKDDKEPLKFRAVMLNEEKKEIGVTYLHPHDVQRVLRKITDRVVLDMGRNPASHPRDFVIDAIVIPPVTIRPDVKKMGGGRSTNDDLTQLIQFMIKKNEAMPAVLPAEIDEKLSKQIFELNNAYYDFVKGGHGARAIISGSAPLNSISLRWRGKQGRFRKNLMGKRTMKCARSYIVGDPSIPPDSIAIPLMFARRLQVEDTVQEFNRKQLMTYFLNGVKKYPGCSRIVKGSTNAEYSRATLKEDFELEVGDKIYRDLLPGDLVLFNRQPSLRPSNICALKAIVYEDEDIRVISFNPLLCPIFNADFRNQDKKF